MTPETLLETVRKLAPCRPTDVLNTLQVANDDRLQVFGSLERLWLTGQIVIGNDLRLRIGPSADVEPIYRPPIEMKGALDSGKQVRGWACSQCLVPSGSQDVAAACCKPWFCRMCGEGTEKYWTLCRRCRNAKHTQRQWDKAAKAERILLRNYAHQYVWLAGDDEPMSVDDWSDHIDEDEDGDVPWWAWASRDLGIPMLDATDLLSDVLAEHHEGAFDEVDVEALQMHLDGWRRTQSVSSFERVEHKIVVIVPDELVLVRRCPCCNATERGPRLINETRSCSHPWHGPVLHTEGRTDS